MWRVLHQTAIIREGNDGFETGKICNFPANSISVLNICTFEQFNDQTPYTIMFGPDKCGNDIKLHFIFKHTNPLNGTVTEKHCRKPK